ncbi:unnamed protein product [Linum trigynum]|uniref:Uncharacterized protein n=1 Tax=Linum trigynum TaxID=586398 RepID=A0AAV2DZV8_9ROSI
MNEALFLVCLNEAYRYYDTLLESIEARVQGEAERGRVEEGLGRKLANAMTCKGFREMAGPDGDAGFNNLVPFLLERLASLSPRVIELASLPNHNRSHTKYHK